MRGGKHDRLVGKPGEERVSREPRISDQPGRYNREEDRQGGDQESPPLSRGNQPGNSGEGQEEGLPGQKASSQKQAGPEGPAVEDGEDSGQEKGRGDQVGTAPEGQLEA